MPKVTINTEAPNFTLENFKGEPISLSDYRDKAHVLLVFNRGFV